MRGKSTEVRNTCRLRTYFQLIKLPIVNCVPFCACISTLAELPTYEGSAHSPAVVRRQKSPERERERERLRACGAPNREGRPHSVPLQKKACLRRNEEKTKELKKKIREDKSPKTAMLAEQPQYISLIKVQCPFPPFNQRQKRVKARELLLAAPRFVFVNCARPRTVKTTGGDLNRPGGRYMNCRSRRSASSEVRACLHAHSHARTNSQ